MGGLRLAVLGLVGMGMGMDMGIGGRHPGGMGGGPKRGGDFFLFVSWLLGLGHCDY